MQLKTRPNKRQVEERPCLAPGSFFEGRRVNCFGPHFSRAGAEITHHGTRSNTAPEDVLSLSYTWSSHKRERQNTLRVVFSNAAMRRQRTYLLVSMIVFSGVATGGLGVARATLLKSWNPVRNCTEPWR